MELSKVIDKSFTELLDKYTPDGTGALGAALKQMIESTGNAETIIPVLGMQGMGKSTLINGVLGENILPNDADETTCVPVEIKYGTDEKADVFFKNNKPIVTVHTREELNRYVDNNENPANQKQVSHIVLYRKSELLKSGLTIVDLPGVGSLTKENQDTTERYIKNLCAAIFVIPTVPTLRRKETSFIHTVWSQFSKAVFVQNAWCGEGSREISESVDFNGKVLKKLAEEIGAAFNDEIIVVNAYNAVEGAIKKDEKEIADSNINTLISKIKSLSENWSADLAKGAAMRAMGFIGKAKKELLDRKKQCDTERSQYRAALRQEYDDYRDVTKTIKAYVSETEDYLRKQSDVISDFAKQKSKEYAGKIRADMYELIDKNHIFDGDELTRAFNDIQGEYTADFSDGCIKEFMRIKAELETKMEQIEDVISNENNMNIENIQIHRDESFKIEKSFTPLMTIAGGIGGVFVGNAAGGAITAALGSLGAAAGPLGIAAGILIGTAITGLGTFLGSKFTKGVRSQRASDTKAAIEPEINKIEASMKKEVISAYDNIRSEIRKTLDSLMDERAKEEKRLFRKYLEDLPEVKYDVSELAEDMKYLAKMEEKIQCLTT